jgi:hypothetical protein
MSAQIIQTHEEHVSNLMQEKIDVSNKLKLVEAETKRIDPWKEFLDQIRRLESHLQRPSERSPFAAYEIALTELSNAKLQLEYAKLDSSILNKIIRVCFFPNGVADLEKSVSLRAQKVEKLRRELKLFGKASLSSEYDRLVGHLNWQIEKGFDPQLTINEHTRLGNERKVLTESLKKLEEKLRSVKYNRVASEVHSRWGQANPLGEITSRKQVPSPAKKPSKKTVFTDSNFWRELSQDLKSAEKSVFMISPYLTVIRTSNYINIFETLIKDKVKICVVTCPSESHDEYMCGQSIEVIKMLQEMGIEVIKVPRIHQKVILIDEKISWEGSMNWLSHRVTAEHMRRLDEPELVSEINKVMAFYKSLRS